MRTGRRAADPCGVEGIAGAQARIAELQSRLTTLRVAPPSSDFAALLSGAAVRPGSPAAPAGTAPASGTSGSAAWSAALRPSVLTGSGRSAGVAGAPTPSLDPASFPNGRIPEAALQSIGGGERLAAPAAAGFLRLRAAAEAAGVSIGVNDSYRSYEEQVDVARRKGLYSEGGLAAEPGTSDHGRGLSVDLQLDAEALAWMRTHASRFGFAEDVPREPWHWTFGG